ncbi:hypothetical protein CAL22_13005 [Bordetella genomosp. 12]|uniref:DUF1275 family protein n=1 Tax=Bordetella genomosp. 12 TaxID=463035 RepID=A0A261V9I5_9BORD|nr:hypothetical protein CAL22_13005 [Bordetella genomosp. 12]
MAIPYLRGLTAAQRTPRANLHLAYVLIFVAGAVNAGGFLAVAQYTSHMSGIVSAMADHLAVGSAILVVQGLAALLAFVCGAATSAWLINFARRGRLASEYALPLLLEAALLLLFGLMGASVERFLWLYLPLTVILLCYIMGLQNAMITKVSRAEIRTTHITGMVTDIGIELGKFLYWNARATAAPRVVADRQKLRVLSLMVALFFVGGLTGALAYARLGFAATLPLALLLAGLAIVPVLDDVRAMFGRRAERMRRR